jgi:branched-chain amino acid transport system substrate-binding protein
MRKVLVISLALALGMGIVFFASFHTPSAAQKPIKVGLLYNLTGIMASTESEMANTMILAIENLLGPEVAGRKIEYILEDGATDPATCLDKSRKLVERDKVDFIFGPLHGGIQLGVKAYEDKVQMPSFVPFITEVGVRDRHWVWSVGGSILQSAFPMGIYVADALPKYKRCSVLASDRGVSKDFIKGFLKAWIPRGGQVVQEQYFPEGTTDFTPYLVKINKDVDFLATWVGDAHQFSFFPQYKEYGLKLPIIQVEFAGPIAQPGINQRLGDSIVGVKTTAHWVSTLGTKGSKEYSEAYKKRFGSYPGPFSGVTFAMAQVFYDVVKRTRGDMTNTVLRKAIEETSLDTVTGHIRFSPNGCAIAPMHVIEVGPKPELNLKVLRTVTTRLDFDAKGEPMLFEVK